MLYPNTLYVVNGILTLRRFIASSPEETFRSLMIYFNGKRMKISSLTRPTFIRAEIGSWLSFTDEGNAKGEVEATIAKANGGSNVYLNFRFVNEYSLGLLAATLGVLSFCLIGLILNILLITSMLSVIMAALIIALEERAVFSTRKKFTREFNMLTQLLSTK